MTVRFQGQDWGYNTSYTNSNNSSNGTSINHKKAEMLDCVNSIKCAIVSLEYDSNKEKMLLTTSLLLKDMILLADVTEATIVEDINKKLSEFSDWLIVQKKNTKRGEK